MWCQARKAARTLCREYEMLDIWNTAPTAFLPVLMSGIMKRKVVQRASDDRSGMAHGD